MIRRKKARKPNPLKVSTRPAVRKGPARDAEHLARIRLEPCVVCFHYRLTGLGAVEAHHVRCIGPRTMGVRVSDHLTIPLCRAHHAVAHQTNEALVWAKGFGIDPAAWIARFSPEGAAEIERINGAAVNKGKVRRI